MAVSYRIVRHERTEPPTASARVHHGQVVSFDKLCEYTSMSIKVAPPGVVKMIVQAALDEALYLAEGLGRRVDIGDKRLSLYVQVHKSVAAQRDPDTGDIRWPADRELRPARGDASLKCEVHKSWNRDFRRKVHWELAKNDRREYRKK